MSGPEQPKPIIDSVPGVERTPEDQREEILHGQVVPVPADKILDPSKVMGHPSNPYTNMDTSGLFPNPAHQTGEAQSVETPPEAQPIPTDPKESK